MSRCVAKKTSKDLREAVRVRTDKANFGLSRIAPIFSVEDNYPILELHCDSLKIKTMINSSLFFLRQCESLDWGDCLVVLLLSATHFRKSGHARLIRGCFSFSQCFRAGVFSSLSPPPPRSLLLAPSPPLFGKFQHGAFASKLRAQRKRLHYRLYDSPRCNTQPTATLIHEH